MDKFVNAGLFNIPNFLLVLFTLALGILVTHALIGSSGAQQGNN